MYSSHIAPRRDFMFGIAAGMLLMVSPRASSQVLRVRKNVMSLDPNGPELSAYKKAISEMKKRPPSDPMSWEAQAGIHLNFCPHSNWYILPWHRAYLQYFEQICRELSGNEEFTLPYWDWTTQNSLPPMFFESSPLFHDRAISQTDVLSEEYVGKNVIDQILALPDFSIFGSSKPTGNDQRDPGTTGMLEGTPHNEVHGFVGGDMWTWFSPRDPIFWLHHCNVDRLWNKWIFRHAGRTPNDPAWLLRQLNSFFDSKARNQVKPSVKSMLDIGALGYAYDDQTLRLPNLDLLFPTSPAVLGPKVLAQSNEQMILKVNDSVSSSLKSPPALSTHIMQEAFRTRSLAEQWGGAASVDPLALRNAVTTLSNRTATSVTIAFADVPPVGVHCRVFLNCDHPSTETPVSDPTYVGSMAFFGAGHRHGSETAGGASYRLFLDPTIQRLAALKTYDFSNLKVSVVAVQSNGAAAAPLTVKGYTIEAVPV